MKLITFLNKHFDIEELTIFDECVKREVYQLWVYEKGEDSEPLLILKDAMDLLSVDGWFVANIYSSLQHGLLVKEDEFKEMVKAGNVKSRYSQQSYTY
ncbi:TPA: hypothetical protein MDW71_005290 [Klebsiella pneumoniae]|nr:hypothetical protein [Klebsiella pneumoniae]